MLRVGLVMWREKVRPFDPPPLPERDLLGGQPPPPPPPPGLTPHWRGGRLRLPAGALGVLRTPAAWAAILSVYWYCRVGRIFFYFGALG